MKCPLDNTELVMSERQGIEIDYCPSCRGVWLDRGELDKIIDRSSSSLPAATETVPREQQAYNDASVEQKGYPRRKKKESFLSDLFDFD